MDYFIEANNISKKFADKVVLDDVSFQVKKGEIFGLLGPNGAGKTTLIRILNGIFRADSGRVKVSGSEISDDSQKSIGYLPEERGLYKKMKVFEHLLYLARLRGLDKATATQNINYWLDKLSIANRRDSYIHELSKGMAQKIQFIATVVHAPDLLILDEPFSGFDPVNTEVIKKEILALKEAGTTILLSTHNMTSVEELCDSILLLNEGKTILEGNIASAKSKFQKNEFEIVFTGNMISFSTAIWTGFEIISHAVLENKRLKVVVHSSGKNSINDLLNAVSGSCKIWSVNELIPSMNDIFIDLVSSTVELNVLNDE